MSNELSLYGNSNIDALSIVMLLPSSSASTEERSSSSSKLEVSIAVTEKPFYASTRADRPGPQPISITLMLVRGNFASSKSLRVEASDPGACRGSPLCMCQNAFSRADIIAFIIS